MVYLQNIFKTIEDTYVAYIDTDRGQKEKVHFYDTAGLVCIYLLLLYCSDLGHSSHLLDFYSTRVAFFGYSLS